MPYLGADGRNRMDEWLDSLDFQARSRVWRRLERLKKGLFGDHRHLGQCLFELREHFGPGYRAYVGLAAHDRLILLLGGGDKSRQGRDIMVARYDWNRYLEEHP
jgi:putative addiction module killer protein